MKSTWPYGRLGRERIGMTEEEATALCNRNGLEAFHSKGTWYVGYPTSEGLLEVLGADEDVEMAVRKALRSVGLRLPKAANG